MHPRFLTGPRITGVLILVALALAAWFILRKPALEVDSATVIRGPMTVRISDLGETRVHDLFTVSAPVTGQLLRVPLKPGAGVVRGQTVLAEIRPITPDPVDPRTYAQTLEQIAALDARVAVAQAQVQQADAAGRLAEANHARYAALIDKGFVSRAQFDQVRAERDRARAASAEARQAVSDARHALQAARAALGRGSASAASNQVVRLTAPVSGTVLTVPRESAGPVVAGMPLVELGDAAAIEVVSDMLSADAVRVRPDAAVEIDAWGGETPLKGKVRLVEPFGFTKISALGVEEQRVNVVIDLLDPPAARPGLGHGYRVIVRIALWSSPAVLQVPIGALFRDGAGWSAFTIDAAGRARRVAVRVGHTNEDVAEVLGGLAPGDRVIVHPGEKVADAIRVRAIAR